MNQGATSFPALERAQAFHRGGKAAEAAAAYRQAMTERPRDPRAFAMAAMLAHQTGDAAQAIDLLGKSLDIDPSNVGLQFNLAALLQGAGRFEDSLARYDEVVRKAPANETAWNNRGNVLTSMGKITDAVESFRRAIAIRPAFLEAHYNLGSAMLSSSAEAALASFDRVLALNSRLAEGHLGRGEALLALERFSEAAASFREAIKIRPDMSTAYNSLGVALRAMGLPDEALKAHRKASAITPDLAEAYYNAGTILADTMKPGEAIPDFDKAISLRPGYGSARWNRGLCHLLMGDFARGWPDYEGRVDAPEFYQRSIAHFPHRDEGLLVSPSRQSFEGRSVVAFEEQGVGDVIMFSSMVPDLTRIARQVSLVVDSRLTTLLQRSLGNVRVMSWDAHHREQEDKHEVKTLLGSLAHAFRNSSGSFPGTPYLQASADKQSLWKQRLGSRQRKVIGVSWRGGTERNNIKGRSIDLIEMKALLSREDCSFVSIQHGASEAEIAEFESCTGIHVWHFEAHELHDLDDLAALISALDAVVTVQNTNVHLSGALGVPCFALLPERPEWRYGITGDHLPWYGSVKLFRRTEGRDLHEVLGQVGAALEQIPWSKK